MIVVSILVAFGLDAYWAARQERGEERDVLRALLREFEVNDSVRVDDRNEHVEVVNAATALLEIVGEVDRGGEIPDGIDSLLSEVTGVRTHSPATGAIRALIEGGRLDLIRSDSLRVALAAWPDVMADLYEDESRNWDFADAVLQPLVGSYVPLTRLVFNSALLPPGIHGVHPTDYVGLLRSRDFANALTIRIDHCTEIARDIYGPIDAESARIIGLLRREIGEPGRG